MSNRIYSRDPKESWVPKVVIILVMIFLSLLLDWAGWRLGNGNRGWTIFAGLIPLIVASGVCWAIWRIGRYLDNYDNSDKT